MDAHFFHQIWQAEDGLAGPVVRSIVQTRDGYLWVATVEGLCRFDGARFTAVDPRTRTEKERQYLALAETSDGSLWSSVSNGLVRITNGRKTYYTVAEGLPTSYVLTVYEDRSKRIWMGCTNGLARFDNGRFVRYTAQQGFIEESVRAILEDREGALWVGTAKGLTCYKNGQTTNYFAPQLPTNGIQCLCQSSDGSLWVGTTWGLARYRNGRWTHYSEADGLAHHTVWSIHEDAAGNLWIGTFGKGVQLFADEKFVTVTIDGEMASDYDYVVPGYTFAITEDKEGDVWVGTSSGLNRLSRKIFRTYRKADGLAETVATSVLESQNGDIWIGTWGGGLSQMRGGRMTTWGRKNGLPERVLGIWEDRSANLWIGGESPALYRLKDGTVESFGAREGLTETVIKVIFEDSQGALWIGGQDGLSCFRNGRFFAYPRSLNTIKSIIQCKEGGLWVGSKQGLTRIINGQLQPFGQGKGLPTDMVNALYEDAEGVLWIGVEQGGVFRLCKGQLTAYPTAQVFDRVLNILEDDWGNLWVSSRKGIFRLSKKELSDYAHGTATSVNSVAYGKLDGMRRAQCNGIAQPAGWKARDGRIWFPTLVGVVAIDRKSAPVNKTPPPVAIEEVLIAGKPVQCQGAPVFPPGAKDIEFKYTALSLQVPEKVLFRYRLDGFDSDWGNPTAERFAKYPHLPPGDYVFRVKACNNEGLWNETGASFEFSLPPLFYKTAGFYTLCALAAVLGGFGIYRLRLRALQQRESELVQLVGERTKSLQQEISDRRQAEKALVESQEMVLRQERLAAVGQLAAGVAHEFNNILTVIQGHTEMLLQKPHMDVESVRSLKHISSGVERTARLTQQMLAFSRKQIMQHQILDLNEVIRHITSMLSHLLTENIALRCECAPGLPTVEADGGMIEQIIMNLAVNSRDAMPKGGELVIRTRLLHFVEADLQNHPEGRTGAFVCASVSDTGCGMDLATINRIFEPFFTTKDVGKGTGLGLATVYGIVKQHQGWIEVDSRVGAGTTFQIYFPACGQALEKPAERSPLAPVCGGGETILIVEDEQVLRELVREILQSHGYQVVEAGNAIEALKIWEESNGKIDLLLTDMVMPEGLSGRELAGKLRALRPTLPIIFSSGYSQEINEFNSEPQRGVAILSKPYHPADLVRLVRECLDCLGRRKPPQP